jgi:hypothetical protein
MCFQINFATRFTAYVLLIIDAANCGNIITARITCCASLRFSGVRSAPKLEMDSNVSVMVSDICWSVSCKLSNESSGKFENRDRTSSIEAGSMEISFSKEEGKELGDESTTTSKVS